MDSIKRRLFSSLSVWLWIKEVIALLISPLQVLFALNLVDREISPFSIFLIISSAPLVMTNRCPGDLAAHLAHSTPPDKALNQGVPLIGERHETHRSSWGLNPLWDKNFKAKAYVTRSGSLESSIRFRYSVKSRNPSLSDIPSTETISINSKAIDAEENRSKSPFIRSNRSITSKELS